MAISPKFEAFVRPCRYKIARGGRGGGKSWAVAELLVQLSRRGKLLILCTREIQRSLQASVMALLQATISRLGIESEYLVLNTEITHVRTGSRFIFAGLRTNPESIKSIEGIDIVWIEEASTVSQDSLDILIPTIRKHSSEIWATYNQRFEDDPIDILARREAAAGNAVIVEVNYYDNPHCSQTLIDEAKACKLRNYDEYRHIWLGEYVKGSELSTIPYNALMACVDAHLSVNINHSGIYAGLDVADDGEDSNALVVNSNGIITDVYEWDGLDVIETAQKAYNISQGLAVSVLNYDAIGVGAGVKAALNRMTGRTQTHPFVAGGKVDKPTAKYSEGRTNADMFVNAKAKAWWRLRDMVINTQDAITNGTIYKPSELISISSGIPDDVMRKLANELTAPSYEYTLNGRIKIESKQDLLARGIKSPNIADALVMSVLPPPPLSRLSSINLSEI